MARYGVVIPALNEEAIIGDCVRRLEALRGNVPVVVVDGGSRDRTAQTAREAGAGVVVAGPGRGPQCNAGAARVAGDILVFLHADTRLPADAFDVLDRCFSDPRVAVGTFRLRFDADHWFLRLCGFFTRFDSLLTRFGDQGIVARRTFFDKVGGFPEWPLFEDVEFLRRARRLARIRSFPAEAVTSARKFLRNGPIRQQAANGYLLMKYLAGVPPEKLAQEYGR